MPGTIHAMESPAARAGRLKRIERERERLARAIEGPTHEPLPAAPAGPPRAIVSAAEVEARRLARRQAREAEARRLKAELQISTAARALIRSLREAEAELTFAETARPPRGLQPSKHPGWRIVGEDGEPIVSWQPAIEPRTGRVNTLARKSGGVFVCRYMRRTRALAHFTEPERFAFVEAVRTCPEAASVSIAAALAREAFRAALDRARVNPDKTQYEREGEADNNMLPDLALDALSVLT